MNCEYGNEAYDIFVCTDKIGQYFKKMYKKKLSS